MSSTINTSGEGKTGTCLTGKRKWDIHAMINSFFRTVSQGIEVFRVRPPGLFHYYHTRAGMWGIRGNKDGC